MEAVAKLRHQRISVRKARVVLDAVRGRNVVEALFVLRHARKKNAEIILKLLESAVANAAHKDSSVALEGLKIVRATADKAPNRFMRRWRPRAMGRATQIQKGMSHIEIAIA